MRACTSACSAACLLRTEQSSCSTQSHTSAQNLDSGASTSQCSKLSYIIPQQPISSTTSSPKLSSPGLSRKCHQTANHTLPTNAPYGTKSCRQSGGSGASTTKTRRPKQRTRDSSTAARLLPRLRDQLSKMQLMLNKLRKTCRLSWKTYALKPTS